MYLSGFWDSGNSGGTNFRLSISQDCRLDFSFTGTALSINALATSSFDMTIDGGATTTPVIGGSGFNSQVLVTGLTDAVHTVTIAKSFGVYLYLNDGSVGGVSFSVTGAAPAITAPDTTLFGTQYPITSNLPHFILEGDWAPTVAFGYPASPALYVVSSFQDYSVGLKTSCTGKIRAWMYGAAASLRLVLDGVPTATYVAIPGDGVFAWRTLATGDGTSHVYRWDTASHSGVYVWALMTCGGTADLTYKALRNGIAYYGDSITNGTTFGDTTLSWARQASQLFGLAVFNRGIGGSYVFNWNGQAGSVRFADITGLSAATMSRIAILYGTNDMSQSGGAETVADYTAAYITMLNGLIAGTGAGVVIDCLSILPRNTVTPNTLALWNAGIVAAIAGCSRPDRCFYWDVTAAIMVNVGNSSNWSDANGDTVDGLHPNAQGSLKVATKYHSLVVPAAAGGLLVQSGFNGGYNG